MPGYTGVDSFVYEIEDKFNQTATATVTSTPTATSTPSATSSPSSTPTPTPTSPPHSDLRVTYINYDSRNEYVSLANYGNDLRRQYNHLLTRLAKSNMLSFLLSQMEGKHVQITKKNPFMWKEIQHANYSLC